MNYKRLKIIINYDDFIIKIMKQDINLSIFESMETSNYPDGKNFHVEYVERKGDMYKVSIHLKVSRTFLNKIDMSRRRRFREC